ncbi:hypothetical protein HJ590_13155 [Naumannella sp. ID2617S]|nr:hypothetical protein [Naumannella sp. ID2617S]
MTARRQPETQEAKTNESKTDEPKVKTYRLESPDGRKYTTTNSAEANQLNRTRGYTIKN